MLGRPFPVLWGQAPPFGREWGPPQGRSVLLPRGRVPRGRLCGFFILFHLRFPRPLLALFGFGSLTSVDRLAGLHHGRLGLFIPLSRFAFRHGFAILRLGAIFRWSQFPFLLLRSSFSRDGRLALLSGLAAFEGTL